ncbi:Emp24/gp25L/p24 family/GOLD protein [Giardia muris]|uniref:Emp24/gp25L/p24 family/GOLD protein n=1 Tax=Giardia muris TaxID=5742 RepID=A0A4Z1SXZ2_GIAMU|nr:Emp24/gp25L/p24 family/GOLD protein [Giardia muris]|eukprot:TNJ30380.1 Emp24/gp25L/p24 family/GOLD protein [Giardia muris]
MITFSLIIMSFGLFLDYRGNRPLCFRHTPKEGSSIKIGYGINTPELFTGKKGPTNLKDPRLQLRILDVHENVLFDSYIVDRGELVFSPSKEGDFRICIWGADKASDRSTGRVHLSIQDDTGVRTLEEERQAVELQSLGRLLGKARAINQQADTQATFLAAFEAKSRRVRRSIILTSLLCILGYLGLTAWQVQTIRGYITRQKLV